MRIHMNGRNRCAYRVYGKYTLNDDLKTNDILIASFTRAELFGSIKQRNQILIKLRNYVNYYTENHELIVKLYDYRKFANCSQ